MLLIRKDRSPAAGDGHREMIMRNAWLALLLVPPALAGVCWYRLGHADAKKLTDFSASYTAFDEAIGSYATTQMTSKDPSPTDDGERRVDVALDDLDVKASARISSLTRNDAEIMRITREIADLSGKEFAAFRTYQRALVARDANAAELGKEYSDLSKQREAAFDSFLELGR